MKKFLNVLKTIYGPQRPETTQILSVDGTKWRDGLRTKLMVHLTTYPLSMKKTAKSEVLYAADSTFWLKKMPYLESYTIQKLTGTNYGVSFLSMFSGWGGGRGWGGVTSYIWHSTDVHAE